MTIPYLYKSKTRQALLRLYFTNPENEYYLRELERLLGIPVSMIRGELQRQEREGLFISRKKGKEVYFSLNKSYPLFHELQSIVSKTIGIEGSLRSAVEEVDGIEVAFIYGSAAKNTGHADSDVDLIVVGEFSEEELIHRLMELERTLGREINYTSYTRSEFQKERQVEGSFLQLVLEETLLLLKGHVHDSFEEKSN